MKVIQAYLTLYISSFKTRAKHEDFTRDDFHPFVYDYPSQDALDFENLKTKVPLNPTTTIRVTSISKLFTTLTIANKVLATDLEATACLKKSSNTLFPTLALSQL
jgi:hypothetical protein